jgi:hypothetical protein
MKKIFLLALLVFSTTQIFCMEKKDIEGGFKNMLEYMEKIKEGKILLKDYLDNVCLDFMKHFKENSGSNKSYTVVAVDWKDGDIKKKFILTGTGLQFLTALKLSLENGVGLKFFRYFEGSEDRDTLRAEIWAKYMDKVIVTDGGKKYVSKDDLEKLKNVERKSLKIFDKSAPNKENKKLVTLKDYAESQFNKLVKILENQHTYFLTFSKINTKGHVEHFHTCNKGSEVKNTIMDYKKENNCLIDFTDLSSISFPYLLTNFRDQESLTKFKKALVYKDNEIYVDTSKLTI